MHLIDYVLIAVLILSIATAIRYVVKRRGSCCGDCASCRACRAQKKKGCRF